MKKAIYYSAIAAVVILFGFGLSSCSAQEVQSKAPPSGDKTLSFYSDKNGQPSYFEVHYNRNNKITSLYIDGKQIPESEIADYKDLITDKLDELKGPRDRRSYVYKFNYDYDKLDSTLKNIPRFHLNDSTFKNKVFKLRKDLDDKMIYFNWNDSAFKADMKNMREELVKLKDHKVLFHFEPEKLKIEMEKMRKELKDININEDMKELKESIRKMTDEIKEKKIMRKIEIEVPDINIELKDLDIQMRGLDKELSGLKGELKKLNNFMDDVRKELVIDGLIKDEDEHFSMTLKKDSMKINNEEVPSNLINKYHILYKKHFGKEISDHQRFEIN
jgi:predicted  nucleic acid-binding Zn-ribbon protein